MITGRMICEGCGKDVTRGLFAFVLGVRGHLNPKQAEQLKEFQDEFGKEKTGMVWCWNCVAKGLGAKPITKTKEIPGENAGENIPQKRGPGRPPKSSYSNPSGTDEAVPVEAQGET
jgi:hypothetical protein